MPDQHTLEIPRQHWDEMLRHIDRLAPLEACGLMAGFDNRVTVTIPVPNELSSPVRFRMEPQGQLAAFEQIDAAGLALLAIFHSHPQGPPVPSPTDIAEAMYPVVNIICHRLDGVWRARGFWIESDQFEEVVLKVV